MFFPSYSRPDYEFKEEKYMTERNKLDKKNCLWQDYKGHLSDQLRNKELDC